MVDDATLFIDDAADAGGADLPVSQGAVRGRAKSVPKALAEPKGHAGRRSSEHQPPFTPAEDRNAVPEPPDREWQEIFIPVHGLVRLRPREVALINHPAFQRLGDVNQLGQTNLIFRGATHKRLEHSLGTLHVAQLMIDALGRNLAQRPRPEDRAGEWVKGRPITSDEATFVRLAALLHDIGHLPVGHTLEDELGLLDLHDGDSRLTLLLDRQVWWGIPHVPTLRALIDTLYGEDAQRVAFKHSTEPRELTASEVFLTLVSKDRSKVVPEGGNDFRLQVCRDIVGNTICADLLDYLHRDWLHLGRTRYFDMRLLDYMEIRHRPVGDAKASLVINLRDEGNLRTDAVTAILDLLESRYQLHEMAIYHRTKICATAMLERAIAEMSEAASKAGGGTEQEFAESLVEDLLDSSDSTVLSMLLNHCEQIEVVAGGASEELQAAESLLRRLRFRQLHSQLFATSAQGGVSTAPGIQHRYAGPPDMDDRRAAAQLGAKNRLTAVRQLETDFGLRRGDLVMYCPPGRMSTKIANVQVLVMGNVAKLDDYEEQSQRGVGADRGLTGGHLAAQKLRFRRLWRVWFGIDRGAERRLRETDLLRALGSMIELAVLDRKPQLGGVDGAVFDLGATLVANPASPLFGKELVPAGAVATRTQPIERYASGCLALTSLIAN
jgi:hypothetical protein